MKLGTDGGTPKTLVMFGEEKSSISLFRTIPVLVINLEPKNVLTDLYGMCIQGPTSKTSIVTSFEANVSNCHYISRWPAALHMQVDLCRKIATGT